MREHFKALHLEDMVSFKGRDAIMGRQIGAVEGLWLDLWGHHIQPLWPSTWKSRQQLQ
jgi:hypothetical protein